MINEEQMEKLWAAQFYTVNVEALNEYAHMCQRRLKEIRDNKEELSKLPPDEKEKIVKESERLAEFGKIACKIRDELRPKMEEAKKALLGLV